MSEAYVQPKIQTLEAGEILEALGPVSAGSGGSTQGSTGGEECSFWDWLWHNC